MTTFTELEKRFLEIDGVQICFRVGGNGPPLVLLHGSPQTSFAWRKLVPALSRYRTLILPDLRGHGESVKPGSEYGIQRTVEDIRKLVATLRLNAVDMVGHDLGGIVAYVYAAQNPGKVRRLGVIEAPIVGVPSPTMDAVLASYWHIGFYSQPHLPELLIRGRERTYLAEFIRAYQSVDGVENEALDEYARHLSAPGGLEGMLGVYRIIGSEVPAIARLTATKLQVPVWAVGGDCSQNTGPLEQFRKLANDVCGGAISGCGHWVLEERPDEVGLELLKFLRCMDEIC